MNNSVDDINEHVRVMRAHVLKMAYEGKTSHVGSALSSVDILAALYFSLMKINVANWDSREADRFILSKGHGVMAWYAALAQAGFIAVDQLKTYALDGSNLGEHPHHGTVPGIKVSTGSLGHGLSIAAGMALAQRMNKLAGRTWVLLSDGECNEGSIWEAAMWAAHQGLDNLTVIIDDNHMQAMGPSREVSGLGDLAAKWQAFGWVTFNVDGHDIKALIASGQEARALKGKPQVIVARTILAKGVPFMENDLLWHYQIPSQEQLAQALSGWGFA